MEARSSEPQLQRPDKSKDDDGENIAKACWQDVRGEDGRQAVGGCARSDACTGSKYTDGLVATMTRYGGGAA